MPYIPQNERALVYGLDVLTPGQLNYVITQWILHFLGKEPNYEKFNAAIGVLQCAQFELYRRMVVPYEQKKMEQNSDVYPQALPPVRATCA